MTNMTPTIHQYRAAREVWADYRAQYGARRVAVPMVSFGGNTKTLKNEVATYDLSLSHANNASSGRLTFAPVRQGNAKLVRDIGEVIAECRKNRLERIYSLNVCPYSTPACRAICVGANGHGGRPSVQFARAVKTRFMADHPVIFRILVMFELAKAVRKHGNIMARLNCYSDIEWETVAPEWFTVVGVEFYDYTKHPVGRDTSHLPNYRLTHSATERTGDSDIAELVASGRNVAVVVRERIQSWPKADVPTSWRGLPAVNGDATDDRFNDPRGVVVLLGAKGPAGPSSPMAKSLV